MYKPMLVGVMLAFPTLAIAADNTVNTAVGEVFVDPNGRTLYTFSKDTTGKSVCNGGCAAKWPPLSVNPATNTLYGSQPGFSIINRDDGSEQWAYRGAPLYRWFKDIKAGDIEGAGIAGVWPLARADDVTVRLYNDDKRRYLVDSDNFTLYTFDKDEKGISNCYGDCAAYWPPALVNTQNMASLKLSGDFGVTKRKDGNVQWTYKGMPLYRWIKDTAPGQTTGDGVKDIWHMVPL
ncbi:hypothetical protein [Grimontia sp. NTOU-MAR1]|uniref:hypothetical protein n=1 Tax=Grimontia sp. NTOU-MAR1 TaxID=3111011 RepID=UPI002DB95FD8|nr:hypothetical protein [Grimontia sp. NTOU-MAR1]WRW00817.1 hypothetical protein VP504_20440 [Grimontia sp. NTOU-MAR1]